MEETARRSEGSLPGRRDSAAKPEDLARADESPRSEVEPTTRSADDEPNARDRALVARAIEDDVDAFNELVALYQDYLFALVVRVVGDRESAADAVQEAFFSAYRNLRRFRGDSFRSWLTRIALNAATDVLRQRKRKPVDHFPEWEDDSWQPPAHESDNPERQAIRRSANHALWRALQQVTLDQRTAILLYDVEGYDYQEIAGMTGVSLGTVKSRIHRGRIALRELLAADMELLRGS
ncbi:MAG: sigma-70 family RNA polymerase sigma factor [Chloroflexota bacterium]|nr:sigma-70 family RNA polymerase sigma factor [Chloroflexota bacterium]